MSPKHIPKIISRPLKALLSTSPAHELVKLTTEWGFTGIDGDRRARELATNDARVRPDWHGYVERVDGADIGEDKRFVYFRFVPRKQKAATMEEWFEALPAAAS
jgi:hypothetical protein